MPRPILLSINNLDTAGMKHVLAAIARRLDRTRFTPVIAINRKTDSELERELSACCDVREMMLRSQGWRATVTRGRTMAARLRSLAPLVHDFDYSSDWTGASLARWAGIAYVVEKTNLNLDSYRWKLKLGLATHIVCLSSAQKAQLPAYQHKLTVVPTGVDIDRIASARAHDRQAVQLDRRHTVLVSVAHLVPVKGYEELIVALAAVKDELPDLRIVAIGSGDPEYSRHLRDMAERHQVAERLLFVGAKSDVASWLKMADGKILATQNRDRREAFGAAIVEAMASSLPVIATRSGGPEDIVVDGETGFLVEGNGPEALAGGLRRFIAARASWASMGERGFQRASLHYREDDMVRAYERVYDAVLAARPHG